MDYEEEEEAHEIINIILDKLETLPVDIPKLYFGGNSDRIYDDEGFQFDSYRMSIGVIATSEKMAHCLLYIVESFINIHCHLESILTILCSPVIESDNVMEKYYQNYTVDDLINYMKSEVLNDYDLSQTILEYNHRDKWTRKRNINNVDIWTLQRIRNEVQYRPKKCIKCDNDRSNDKEHLTCNICNKEYRNRIFTMHECRDCSKSYQKVDDEYITICDTCSIGKNSKNPNN